MYVVVVLSKVQYSQILRKIINFLNNYILIYLRSFFDDIVLCQHALKSQNLFAQKFNGHPDMWSSKRYFQKVRAKSCHQVDLYMETSQISYTSIQT